MILPWIRKIAENEFLQSCILFLILLNGALIWMGTYPTISDTYGDLFGILLWTSQIFFTFEIIIRILSYHPRKIEFFSEFWNNFDFILILLSYIPAIWNLVLIGRILRLFRLLRIFSVSDTLRTYLDQMKKGSSIIFYTVIIYIVLAYIFAVSGFYFFSTIDPSSWWSLHQSIASIFYLSLTSHVFEIIYPLLEISFGYIFYFLFFYIVITTLIINTLSAIIHKYSHK